MFAVKAIMREEADTEPFAVTRLTEETDANKVIQRLEQAFRGSYVEELTFLEIDGWLE